MSVGKPLVNIISGIRPLIQQVIKVKKTSGCVANALPQMEAVVHLVW